MKKFIKVLILTFFALLFLQSCVRDKGITSEDAIIVSVSYSDYYPDYPYEVRLAFSSESIYGTTSRRVTYYYAKINLGNYIGMPFAQSLVDYYSKHLHGVRDNPTNLNENTQNVIINQYLRDTTSNQ